jgi:tetratricopeptide (TPR) repeat protein
MGKRRPLPGHPPARPPTPGTRASGDPLKEARAAWRAGRLEEAEKLVDAVLVLDGKSPEALHLSGLLALESGRLEKASARLRQAAMLSPRDPEILTDFARVLERAGNRQGAEAGYRAALTLDPGFAEAALALGGLLETLWRDAPAAEVFESLVRQRPDLADGHARLAAVKLRMMEPEAAIESARRALKLKPDLTFALQTLGSALDTLGRYEEAVAVRRRAIGLNPRSGALQYDLGMTHMHHGQLAAAEASFRAALALEPDNGSLHRALAFLVPHKTRDADIAALERVRRANSASDDDRMHAAFGLGKALDDIGAHDEAFGYFLEANRLKRAVLTYTSEETDRLFDKMKAVFTPERFASLAGQGCPDETPIFVLGMPRSGTSLVEQVLASHPEVAGGGEFRLVNQLMGGFAGGAGFPLAEALDAVSPGALREMGESYVRQVRALSPKARFITDKLPGNFIMIGFIRLILPNAKIIHCRRDAVDTCLSIFKNFFAAEHLRYAYDLGEIGHYYRRYEDLMAHWHRVLPGFVYDVAYERLIDDFEPEVRRLLDHCGLEWREECREFFAARRSVQTASSVQVRKPLYKSSIGQAARYGDRIAPLLAALRG